MTLFPERCTETDNVYQVSFQTKKFGEDVLRYSQYSRKKGSIRLCCVPGAGVRPMREIRIRLLKGDYIEVGIHGISVTMQQSVA